MQKSILENVRSGKQTGPVITDAKLSPVDMKNIFNEIVAVTEGYTGVFSGSDAEGYTYYAGGKQLDARRLGEMMKDHLSAKGGGSEEMIQGRIQARAEDITEFWNKYVSDR